MRLLRRYEVAISAFYSLSPYAYASARVDAEHCIDQMNCGGEAMMMRNVVNVESSCSEWRCEITLKFRYTNDADGAREQDD